jgi:threonine dehydratase
LRANIVETEYDRTYYGVNLGDTAIDISMETRGQEHIQQILSELAAAEYKYERIE